MNRITARDHRAVVIRWTPTMTTPAYDNPAKKSQLAWNARQTRSGAAKSPTMKTRAPTANSTSSVVLSPFGIGRLDADNTSAGVGTRGACNITGGAPAFWSAPLGLFWSCQQEASVPYRWRAARASEARDRVGNTARAAWVPCA